ncbi:ferritin-like domain-containing protein [Sphingomonas sp. PB2P19]|uniref:ferritin-like domain-containing protein n=1 Tax=Sphingomonas rhamnosi TaxID=3096156 RepID=UPI002FC81A1D
MTGPDLATGDRKSTTVPLAAPGAAGDVERLNVALNLAYLGAQYHRIAVTGDGLPRHLLAGIGELGSARGGRKIAFHDPDLARYADEIAGDKVAHVAALRSALGNAAAAQPSIDLTQEPYSAFFIAGRAARLNGETTTFDPFSGDPAFLLGAFVVGNEVAACNRMLLLGILGATARTTVAGVLADSIYHGGLIRSLLETKAAADPMIARALASLGAMQALATDGTRRDGQASGSGAYGADLIDAAGNPIPFLRSPAQAMTLQCSPTADCPIGFFFPAGFNGLAS